MKNKKIDRESFESIDRFEDLLEKYHLEMGGVFLSANPDTKELEKIIIDLTLENSNQKYNIEADLVNQKLYFTANNETVVIENQNLYEDILYLFELNDIEYYNGGEDDEITN